MRSLMAIIKKERDWYVALCPELDVVSQGKSVDEAKENLHEALDLFFEHAPKWEISARQNRGIYVTHIDVLRA